MMFGMGSTNVYAAQPDETNTTLNGLKKVMEEHI